MATKRSVIKKFIKEYNRDVGEKQETQKFWHDFLRDVLDVDPDSIERNFEDKISKHYGQKGDYFRDVSFPDTKVLIEQKSSNIDLDRKINGLTPFEQAKRYADELPNSKKPKWIITSNFHEFRIYDLDSDNWDIPIIETTLEKLTEDHHYFEILIDKSKKLPTKEEMISIKAAEMIHQIYDAVLNSYKANPDIRDPFEQANIFCTRLVFLFYADKSGLFHPRDQFYDFINKDKKDPTNFRRALISLFKALNEKQEDRDKFESKTLLSFPYVNGGLFERSIEIPNFSKETIDLIIDACHFKWNDISPTIFGAMFESTINPETRRSGGMHYTSIENIHKVIDPLFLDDLKEELDKIIEDLNNAGGRRTKALNKFRKKLGKLKFLDPACGSGNFLTETFICLRKLENKAIEEILKNKGQIYTYGKEQAIPVGIDGIVEKKFDTIIQVTIDQFYGIEINDFAVSVAKTALFIAEYQMLQQTQSLLDEIISYLPLRSYENIHEENALRIDWNDVIPANECNYIMGNPPFVGFNYQTKEQKKDLNTIFGKIKSLDYICCWFKKTSDYISKKCECAYVATSSIIQGEAVAKLWELLDIKIDFAYLSFAWNNESAQTAHVYCVIIGFSREGKRKEKKIFYSKNNFRVVDNINPYLVNSSNFLVKSRNTSLCPVPKMVYGNKPADGGNLIIENKDLKKFIKRDPGAKKFIKPLIGAKELLNNKKRWCLWLVDSTVQERSEHREIRKRIKLCKEMRENSKAKGIRKFSITPHLFAQITQPENKDYLVLPYYTPSDRPYIPMDFKSSNVKVTNLVQIIPEATIYHFGILNSYIHNLWTRTVAGRLGDSIRYSKDVVYNNFIWPNPTEKQKEKIRETSAAILHARELYPNSSLAALYNSTLMPPELRKAHEENDKAVMEAYNFDLNMTDNEIVSELMKLYKEKLDELEK